jgi:hypothetical protein
MLRACMRMLGWANNIGKVGSSQQAGDTVTPTRDAKSNASAGASRRAKVVGTGCPEREGSVGSCSSTGVVGK